MATTTQVMSPPNMEDIRTASEAAEAKLRAAGVRRPDAVFGSTLDGPSISLVWQDGSGRTELVFDGSDKPQLIEVGTGPWDERISNVLGVRDGLRGGAQKASAEQ